MEEVLEEVAKTRESRDKGTTRMGKTLLAGNSFKIYCINMKITIN